MANIGPFPSFVFPGVITQTFDNAATASAAGAFRVPAFIGIGAESQPVTAYEMIRGSSALADNAIVKEDVSSQVGDTGTQRAFQVSYYPITTGVGTGTVTTNPTDVMAFDNGIQVPVASVDGTHGIVYLMTPPAVGDTVQISYYFKQTDTYYPNQDVSAQADGTNLIFMVGDGPIVTGQNGGIYTTSTSDVTVKVNNVVVPIASVDGANSLVTLVTAPAYGATVTISYYGNIYQYTYDILPSDTVRSITKIGYNSTSNDFVNGRDFVLDTNGVFNTVNWGNSVKITDGTTTSGFNSFYSDIDNASVIDNQIFRVSASGTVDGTNKAFVLADTPVIGNGLGKPTNDLTKIKVYVGTNPYVATIATVETLNAATKTILLQTAPSIGQKVYVTQYESLITDDTWDVTVISDGTYSITNTESESAWGVVYDSSASSGHAVTYPAGLGLSDALVPPATGIDETITLTFHGDSTSASYYTVSSTVSGGSGSGSDNTGYLNQTYIDTVTGFRITIVDVATSYHNNTILVYTVSSRFITNINYQYGILGIRFVVSTMVNLNPTDTAVIYTFNKSGIAPNVGDFYFVSFLNGIDFNANGISTPVFVTRESDAFAYSGPISATNKLSLAAHLAFLNGAGAMVLCQIKMTPGGTDAPDSLYMSAIDLFDTPLSGGLRPALLEPLTTSIEVLSYAKTSNTKQASYRYGNERMTYFGFPVNTTPATAMTIAQSMNSERMIAIYPDGGLVSITDANGNVTSFLVDGSLLAAAVAGIDTDPAFDVATPLLRQQIVGFQSLSRQLDSVTQAQVSNAGITLLDQQAAGIYIKMDLTTDLSSVLTQIPSVVRTKDSVQQGIRAALAPYIGSKLLTSQVSDIASTTKGYLSSLQRANIITAFKGVTAAQDLNDPTTVNVTASYSPIFPLRWILVTFNLQATL
jgi:hypothetical protein